MYLCPFLLLNLKREGLYIMEKFAIDLCTKKQNKQINKTWEDLALELGYPNGEELRQHFKRWRKANGLLPSQENMISKQTQEKIDELDKKMFEFQKEKMKLQQENLERRRWVRGVAKIELIAERLENAVKTLKPLSIPKKIKARKHSKSGILGLADMHFGKTILVRGLEDEIINRYNSEIFEARMWKILYDTIDVIKRDELGELHVFNLGDAIDGLIHINQLLNAEFGVIDSIVKLSEFLSIWLHELSKNVKVVYHSTLGNHPEIRSLKTKAGELDKENLERLIHEFIDVRLKGNPNIDVKSCKRLNYTDVDGVKVLGVHGQWEKGKLEDSLKNYLLMYKKPIDLLISGHLHSNIAKNVGINANCVQFGSICGPDDFSVKIQKTSNASSKILIIEDGWVSIEYNLNLQKII